MVFYDYIKGVSAESGNPITKIIFQEKSGEGKNDAYPLITADGNDGNLGYLLTTEGDEQIINKDISLKSSYLKIKDSNDNDVFTLNDNSLTSAVPFEFYSTNLLFKDNSSSTLEKIKLDGSNGNLKLSNQLEAKNIYLNNATAYNNEVGVIKTTGNGFIQAPYFVATSDRRAKENIVSLPPLLNYVRSIPVYSFNFRDNPSEPSIGIMAQDVESRFVGPFNLVQQPADPSSYKAIRESKLVYILWKAVQDLADEVDSLKWRLSKLEQGEGGN